MYYFVRITPANLLYALWLSLRQPVAAWKLEVPEWLGRRFQRVRPYRLFSRDEWLLAHDRAFDLWQRSAFPSLSERFRQTLDIGARRVDFSRNLWQLLGMEFEALCVFVVMLEKQGAAGDRRALVVEPRVAAAFTRHDLQRLFPSVRFMRSTANRFLEHVHEWLVSTAHLARQVVYLGFSFSAKSKQSAAGALVWLGISPQEIADRADRLDFAWAAEHGYVFARDVLFFLPQALTPAQRSHLDARQIQYVEPADSLAILPMEVRFRVVATAFAGFVSALFRPAAAAPLIARFMTRAPYWDAVFTQRRTHTYVTTTSYSWPEKPELAVTSARGIRSIIWAYSANSLSFTNESAAYRDVGVLRSIVIADEFWVWNRAYADWLLARRVELAQSRCDIRVVGPLMCGNPSLLTLDPHAARARLGLPRDGCCIGVFDMPPISDTWRDRFGGGPPMVDTETYVEFWKAIEQVVLRVPGTYALVKLKRDFTHTYREFPDLLRALLDESGEHMRTGRVRRVDVNVDPYLPIAACDIAIGIAYTSPVLAARAAGKPGYYLDPRRRANFPSNPDYRLITIHTADEAVRAVVRARDEARAEIVSAPAVTPPLPSVPFNAPRTGPL